MQPCRIRCCAQLLGSSGEFRDRLGSKGPLVPEEDNGPLQRQAREAPCETEEPLFRKAWQGEGSSARAGSRGASQSAV